MPKSMMIQSSGRSLSIDFFSDEEVQQILNGISEKINVDIRRADRHKRYYLLVKFLYRTGGRIDEILIVKPSDVNLATNSTRSFFVIIGRFCAVLIFRFGKDSVDINWEVMRHGIRENFWKPLIHNSEFT